MTAPASRHFADEKCRFLMGTRNYYLNADQDEAIRCRCIEPEGHEGPHRCVDHPDSPQPRSVHDR